MTDSGQPARPPAQLGQYLCQRLLCLRLLFLRLLATALAALWLWQHPNLLATDDALFFSRGIDRFSVLEFAPHFPGYPAYLWLAQGLSPWLSSPEQTLLSISRSTVLALAWLSYGLLRSLGCRPWPATLAMLLCLLDPILLGLGLQGLSETPSLCWLVAGCWALVKQRWLLAGLLLGLCLATRPSYLPMLLPLFGYLHTRHRGQSTPLLAGLMAVALLSLGYLLSRDGGGYFVEGWRFLQGHFTLWGNSALAERQSLTWGHALFDYLGPFNSLQFAVLLALALGSQTAANAGRQPGIILGLLFAAALLWTLVAQNPHNLRHLAPLVWCLYCLGALGLNRLTSRRSSRPLSALLLGASIWQCSEQVALAPAPPPIHQAIQWLDRQAIRAVVSNQGIELLRRHLPAAAVTDGYYPGAAQRTLDHGGWRLTTTPLAGDNLQVVSRFEARTPVEKTLWLYRQQRQPPIAGAAVATPTTR